MGHLVRWGQDVLVTLGVAIVPAAIAWAVLTWRRSRSMGGRHAAWSALVDVGLVLSLVLIAVVGLRPGIGVPGGFVQWNLVPFRDLARAIDDRPWGLQPALAGVAANVAVFVPWGLFFALRFPGASWRLALGLTAAMALGIELWQAIVPTGRSSDVTDMLTNTAGGVLGFALARGLQRAGRRFGRRLTRRADDQHAAANSAEAPIP